MIARLQSFLEKPVRVAGSLLRWFGSHPLVLGLATIATLLSFGLALFPLAGTNKTTELDPIKEEPRLNSKLAQDIQKLNEGVTRDFVHSILGTPSKEIEFPFPAGVAEVYVEPEMHTLVGYRDGKLVLLAVQPFDRVFREQIRMPKPHLAVEMDFGVKHYSELEVDDEFWTRDFTAWFSSPVAVPTPRDFRYGEYWHYWGPHFDQSVLAISTPTILASSIENADEGSVIRKELGPEIIAYFPISLLWPNADNFGSREPLDRLSEYLSDYFELIAY